LIAQAVWFKTATQLGENMKHSDIQKIYEAGLITEAMKK
jgi:hypothetical protein